MRHPMYAAHLYWAVANVMIIPNWLAGSALLVVVIFFLPYRIKREEKMMKKQFGEEYQKYICNTWFILPKHLPPVNGTMIATLF